MSPAETIPHAAANMSHGWLLQTLVYLGAAVVAVPVARIAGLGSIIGYLAAGIAIGPWGLGLVTDAQDMIHFAEFGVVLMLFLVGLELEPARLWDMRHPIFGWGSVQLLGSAGLMTAVAVAVGVDWHLGLIVTLGLSLSSTAIGLSVLAERNLMATTSGHSVLSVALLQDIAAIPIMALVPIMAGEHHQGQGWIGVVKVVSVIGLIVLGGRRVLRPALRWIARSKTPEIFTAAALLLVVATAALMEVVGLSMALGAFLAGVLLAESEFRRELETDLEPFKGLLLGLFFIAVGMSIDFSVVLHHPWIVLGLVVAVTVLKMLVLWGMSRVMPIPIAERPVFIVLLAQGGEFGFVVFQAAQQRGVINDATASLLIAVVAMTMLLTPLLLLLADKTAQRRSLDKKKHPDISELSEPQDAPVIIVGFGRYGQIVGRLLYASGMKATVLEHDADQVESLRKFGWRVFYGDATRLDMLRTAGAAQARVLVVAVDGVKQSLAIVDLAQQHFPQLVIVARARNALHWHELHRRGVQHIERETFDSALMSGRSVLETLGFRPYQARTLAQRFRKHSVDQLHEMAPHYGDEARLVAMAKAGRQQLEAMFAQERETHHQQAERAHGPAESVAPPLDDPANGF